MQASLELAPATPSLRAERYVDRIDFIVEAVVDRRVLDCGVVGETCDVADARVEKIVSSLHFRVAATAREAVGIDHAADVVRELQERHPHLSLRACDIEAVEEAVAEWAPFELVLFGDLAEHLSNPGRALDAVRAVLVPGGELILTTPNAFGLPNYVRFVTGRFREGGDHVASYNKYTLRNLLERHGFVVERVLTALDRPPQSRLRRELYRPAKLLLRLFPELGGTLVVVARRER